MNPVIVPTKFTLIDDFTARMNLIRSSSAKFAADARDKFNKAGKTAFKTGRNMAIVAASVVAPLAIMSREAVKFEDKMSDIAKTTGMQGADLTDFGNFILDLSKNTRSSVEDLSTIAEIGGRLAVPKKDLKAFTVEANKFAVALGGDFSGGVESAITEFGKIKSLFRDTKDLEIADSLKKAGSAFNSLSAKGVNVEGLTDFSLRVGALPEVLRPSLASTSALGATLQKSGVDAQIAASGFSNFIKEAGNNLPAFAKQMNMTQSEAENLFNTDTASFFAQFAASLKGVPANELAIKLSKLKLNSLEVQKAVGAMAGSQDVYNEMLKISNDQMKSGSSIQEEYNTKNDNMAGKLAKLKNSLSVLAIKLGQALLPIISELVDTVSPMLTAFSNWISRNKSLSGTIAKVVVAFGLFAGAVSVVSFAIGIYQKAAAIATIASEAFALATGLALGPVLAVVGGVVALGAAIYIVADAFSASTAAEKVNAEVKSRALEKTADQRAEVMVLFNTLRKAKEGTEAYTTALKRVEEISPGIVAKYDLQTKSVKRLNEAQKELIANITKAAEAEVRKELLKESIRKEMDIKEGRDESWQEWGAALINSPGLAIVSKQKRIADEQASQKVLSEQIANDEMGIDNTPAKGKTFGMGEVLNRIIVDFQNMPEGVKGEVPTNPSKGTSIKLNTTR